MSIWSHDAVERILCSKDAAGRLVSTAGARLHLRVGSRYLIRSEKGVRMQEITRNELSSDMLCHLWSFGRRV